MCNEFVVIKSNILAVSLQIVKYFEVILHYFQLSHAYNTIRVYYHIYKRVKTCKTNDII